MWSHRRRKLILFPWRLGRHCLQSPRPQRRPRLRRGVTLLQDARLGHRHVVGVDLVGGFFRQDTKKFRNTLRKKMYRKSVLGPKFATMVWWLLLWLATTWARQRNVTNVVQNTTKKRGHVRSSLVTAIVTTCGPDLESQRFPWLLITLRTYLSREYDDIFYRIIVVWNSGDPIAPELERLVEKEELEGRRNRLVVLEAGSKSLNNRWIKTIPFVATEMVLNIDDDIVALKPAIQCMLLNTRPNVIAGPFARTVGKYFNYSTDERTSGAPKPDYALILPRIMLLKRHHLIAYSQAPREFLRYIDSEPSHSDDILLNLVAPEKLRVIPPPGSVVDYDRLCHAFAQPDKKKFSGLGTMKHRAFSRTAAMRTMGLHYTNDIQYTDDSRTCDLLYEPIAPLSNESSPFVVFDDQSPQDLGATWSEKRGFHHVLRARDVVDYEHWALTDDMFSKFRRRDADHSANAICGVRR